MKNKRFKKLFLAALTISLMTCISGNDVQAADTHANHRGCGCSVSGCVNIYDHDDSGIQTWKGTTTLPSSTGYYYLTKDIEFSSTWSPADGTFLCLNGHTITYKKTTTVGDESAISITDGKTFYLCDCVGTGKITSSLIDDIGFNYGTVRVNGINSTFCMYGGTISGNNSFMGGGIAVMDRAVLEMYNNAAVKNNTCMTLSDGGGVMATGISTIRMYDNAVISGNQSGRDGGGISIDAQDKVYMYDNSSISGNKSKYEGGGIEGTGQIYMYDNASITGNTALTNGGGIYQTGSSSMGMNTYLQMSGNASISDNVGGGVYYSGTKISISGNASVSGNKKGSADQNIYFPSTGKYLTISDTLKNQTKKIGIKMNTAGTFTNGWKAEMGDADPTLYFFSDSPDYEVKLDANGEVQLAKHAHKWTYSLETAYSTNDTISAVCDCSAKGYYTLVKPALTAGSGSASATITGSMSGVSKPAITYAGINGTEYESSTTAPETTGSYRASITIDGTTAYVEYAIPENVKAPTANAAAGNYTEVKSVELGCETEGAVIYYTTDGTEPSRTNGTQYTGPVSVGEGTTTIKAIAVKDGLLDSEVSSFTYVVTLPTIIEHMDIKGCSAPVAGGKFSAMASTETPGVIFPSGATHIHWNPRIPDDFSAEYNTVYKAYCYVAAAEGYQITEDTTATFAKRDAEVSYSEYNDCWKVEVTFPATAKAKLLSIITPEAVNGIANGTELSAENMNLPDTVAIKTEGNVLTEAAVSWDLDNLVSGSYDPSILDEQTFVLKGTVVIPNGSGSTEIDINGVALETTIQVTVAEAGTTGTPDVDKESGVYDHNIEVTLTAGTEGSSIYYTLDGTDPTPDNGILYNGPIAVTGNEGESVKTVLKAIAVKDGMKNSEIVTREYTIEIPEPTYTITLETDGNGTLTAMNTSNVARENTLEAKEGDIIELTAIPAEGYEFKEWQSSVKIENNQFTMPADNVTVKVIFEEVVIEDDDDNQNPGGGDDNDNQNPGGGDDDNDQNSGGGDDENKEESSDAVQTGDSSNPFLLLMVMLSSAIVFVTTLRKRTIR